MAMTVTQLARSAGIAPPTVRYYDRIGLLRPEARSDSGYRLYSPSDESRLRFIRRAKLLGLSLDEIRELMVAAEDGCGSTLPELDRMLARFADLRVVADTAGDGALAPVTLADDGAS